MNPKFSGKNRFGVAPRPAKYGFGYQIMGLKKKYSGKPYRKNIGVVVFNSQGRVLAGERLNYPGVYQFPQGGLDPGETALAAARRELYEETSLDLRQDPVFEYPDWLFYEFPPELQLKGKLSRYRGQAQRWFFFFWDGDIDKLELDLHEPEFSRMVWMGFPELTGQIVAFKKPVYQALERLALPLIHGYLADRQTQTEI